MKSNRKRSEAETGAGLQHAGQRRGADAQGEVDVFGESGSAVQQDGLSANDEERDAAGLQLAGDRREQSRKVRSGEGAH
jgi:hypothetical protein